jgi:cell division protein FtsW (lipid II flippase)
MALTLAAVGLHAGWECLAGGWRRWTLHRHHRRAGRLETVSLTARPGEAISGTAAAGPRAGARAWRFVGTSVRTLGRIGLEAALIGGAAGVALLGPALALEAAGRPLRPALEPAIGLTAAFLLVHLWLRLARPNHDRLLLPLTLLLCGLGWTVLTRTRIDLLPRACAAAGIGLFLLVWLAHARWVRRLERYRYLCMALGVGLLAATAFFGREVNGAKLSLGTDQFSFQPTEAVKMLLAIFTAGLLADRKELLVLGRPRHRHPVWYDLRYLTPLFLVWGVAEALLIRQNDLGASLLLFGIFAVLLYAVTGQLFYVVVSAGLFAGGAAAAYLLIDRVQLRMALWWDPWPLAEGKGYQAVQALYALGSGGLTGLGVGAGFPRLLPAVHTDLPLALLGEELGLIGTLLLVLTYISLLGRGVRAALRAGEDGGGLLALGLTAALGMQTIVIIGGVTRVLPLTGITLPFVSYGGASLVANMALIGMLINLSGPLKGRRPELTQLRSAQWRRGARRVGLALAAALCGLGGALYYWQWERAPGLSFHAGNRRLSLIETRVQRGALRDRRGRPVVTTPRPPLVAPRLSVADLGPRLAGWQQEWTAGRPPERKPRPAGRDAASGRRYLAGGLTAPFTGYIHPLYGRTAAERVAHRWLVGIPEVRSLEAAVRWSERHPRGNDVNMTLDMRVQQAADRALGARRGSVVALDPRTGEVLALVGHPSFDPSLVASHWRSLQRDPRRPLLCRPTQGLYPPGSSFKLVTATAALETGVMQPGTPCFCGGGTAIGTYHIPCFRGTVHGRLSFGDALARSCNVTFARVGMRLGQQPLLAQASRFGLGQSIPGDLETAPTLIPDGKRRLRRATVAQIAFGQGPLAVTPLQMAMIAAAIANDGVMMRPGIFHSAVTPEGKRVARATPRPLRRAMSRKTAQALRAMMTRGVASGTGGRARLPGVAVAGKTGTAQNPHGEDHAWFVGFAPADKPRVAVAVLVENGGIGGRVAAPVAREVLAAALGVSLDEAAGRSVNSAAQARLRRPRGAGRRQRAARSRSRSQYRTPQTRRADPPAPAEPAAPAVSPPAAEPAPVPTAPSPPDPPE